MRSADPLDQVKATFLDFPKVVVAKGETPQVLTEVSAKTVALLHIDLNNPASFPNWDSAFFESPRTPA